MTTVADDEAVAPVAARKKRDPPAVITGAPFVLDDLLFTPDPAGRMEHATYDALIGTVLLDDNRFWFARKVDGNGELTDWKPMRCAAEARAFLVSGIRT